MTKIVNTITRDIIIEDELPLKRLVEKAINEGFSLKGADLEGANLRGADLEGANLEGADLIEADLEGTVISSKTKHKNINLKTFNFKIEE